MKYRYLRFCDILQAGDEYHESGTEWIRVDAKHVGHQKCDIFPDSTRVRRPTASSAEQLRQEERF